MAAERQSGEGCPWIRQRGSTMAIKTNAPEITRIVAKLAASMSSCPKARRQSSELAAKANIEASVSNKVLTDTELILSEEILVTSLGVGPMSGGL